MGEGEWHGMGPSLVCIQIHQGSGHWKIVCVCVLGVGAACTIKIGLMALTRIRSLRYKDFHMFIYGATVPRGFTVLGHVLKAIEL